eukprot:jgi/Bigna1/78201/fgenesh1_pg.53_\
MSMPRRHPASSHVWTPDQRLAISYTELFVIVSVSALQIKAIIDTVPISTWNERCSTKMSKFWHATMFYIATTLIATYAIILNIALPSDFCGNALMAFLPPYYLVRWALYTLLTAKGDAMNVANSHAALFRGVWICAAFVTPVLLSIYTGAILSAWNLEMANVDGKELCIANPDHLSSTEIAAISALTLVIVVMDILIFTSSTFSLAPPICILALSSTLAYHFAFLTVNLENRFAVIRVDLDYLLLDITVNFIFVMASFRTCNFRRRSSTGSKKNEMKITKYINSRAKQADRKDGIHARAGTDLPAASS